ncbi:MAG: hypothetical protein WD030_02605, partial [Pirellulales bacterium]
MTRRAALQKPPGFFFRLSVFLFPWSKAMNTQRIAAATTLILALISGCERVIESDTDSKHTAAAPTATEFETAYVEELVLQVKNQSDQIQQQNAELDNSRDAYQALKTDLSVAQAENRRLTAVNDDLAASQGKLLKDLIDVAEAVAVIKLQHGQYQERLDTAAELVLEANRRLKERRPDNSVNSWANVPPCDICRRLMSSPDLRKIEYVVDDDGGFELTDGTRQSPFSRESRALLTLLHLDSLQANFLAESWVEIQGTVTATSPQGAVRFEPPVRGGGEFTKIDFYFDPQYYKRHKQSLRVGETLRIRGLFSIGQNGIVKITKAEIVNP